MSCPNCGNQLIEKVREVSVTTKQITANLFHCKSCDYLYLSDPDWLDIAYEAEFYGDTGYVMRNMLLTKRSLTLIRCWKIISNNRLAPLACDIGAGLGMYARSMRDNGYQFFGSDEYSKMPLIQPFIGEALEYPIKTAFEVIEHLPSLPIFLKEKIQNVDLFLFTTDLRQTGDIPKEDWWYYAFPVGQHIGFHSKKSLRTAFSLAGYNPDALISYGSSIHALANTKEWMKAFEISRYIWKLGSIFNSINRRIFDRLLSEKSLTFNDCTHAMNRLRK